MATKKLQILDYKIKQADNANTVGGLALEHFATAADMTDVQSKVGDKSVSEQITTGIANKVDKVDGKGLSTNDYTTAEKNKLAGIAEGANKTIVDSAMSSTSTNPVQNKVVNAAINNLTSIVGDTPIPTQVTNAIDKMAVQVDLNGAPAGNAVTNNADTLGGKTLA